MSIRVDVQIAVASDEHKLPTAKQFKQWVAQALHGRRNKGELTIRIVDANESTQLNETYRHKSGPTNVLSFPCEAAVPMRVPLLGDLVICAAVVEREAQQQHKPLEAHWAHMVIHGTLHLLGFDHLTEAEAKEMEGMEVNLLQQMGYANPYETGMSP
jgi:probable rRNA maturation factor